MPRIKVHATAVRPLMQNEVLRAFEIYLRVNNYQTRAISIDGVHPDFHRYSAVLMCQPKPARQVQLHFQVIKNFMPLCFGWH